VFPAVDRPPQRWAEYGLDACVFALLPLLVLASRGIAPLVGIAGALALVLAWPDRAAAWRRLWPSALLLAAVLAWGLLSASWATDPQRSLLMTARLAGLFAAGLALVAGAEAIAAPQRLLRWLLAGLALALALTVVQFYGQGWLTAAFVDRQFALPMLNQVENGLALLLAPVAAVLAARRRLALAALVAVPAIAAIYGLVGTMAKAGFTTGIAAAVLLYVARGRAAHLAAAVSVLVILTAPLTFPALLDVGPVYRWAEGYYKFSARHRLYIWSFAGDRIVERPLVGWGLDASRSIPGGTALNPEGMPWLPLHPHNAMLQVWLELGLPGAALFALFVARLWLGLAALPWPRLYAAAAGASLCAAQLIGLGAYGMWEEWWIGTEVLALFLILALARLAAQPIPDTARGSIS
jgi:O-antigen ligase